MPTNKELAKDVSGLSEKLDSVVESSNKALDDLDKKIDTKFDSISESISALTSSLRAKDSPASIRKHFEPMEQDVGTEDPVEFNEENIVIPRQGLKDVDSPESREKNEMERFMNETVTVMVHEKPGQNPENVFSVYVNGKEQLFIAGREHKVKRMFVEGLARAKPIHYGNDQYQDGAGISKVRHPVRRSLRHPFSIVQDPNPKGAEWLKSVLAQG